MNPKQRYINAIIDVLNKKYGKSSNPKKDYELFASVLGYATEKVGPELVNVYEIEDVSDLYYEIINRYVRDNYDDGNRALPGDRIRLINMPDDPNPIDTINMFGEDHLNVDWDNGRNLNLIVGVDEFEVIEKDEQNNFKR
jgi:hypothetical protein